MTCVRFTHAYIGDLDFLPNEPRVAAPSLERLWASHPGKDTLQAAYRERQQSGVRKRQGTGRRTFTVAGAEQSLAQLCWGCLPKYALDAGAGNDRPVGVTLPLHRQIDGPKRRSRAGVQRCERLKVQNAAYIIRWHSSTILSRKIHSPKRHLQGPCPEIEPWGWALR